tara:strand:+ start:136 stop:267 length:132 start_codon:yes stop_codon:yes gene_type:complete
MGDMNDMDNMEEMNIIIVGGMMAGVIVFTTMISSLLYCVGDDL